MPAEAVRPYTNGVVERMFIATADQNYVGARSSYFDQRDWDFWWLSLHAIEKYLKAILLMNGHSSKDYNHSIPDLLAAVEKLDPRLKPPIFTKPKIEHVIWADYPDGQFIKRLNEYGSANNRYGTYGYTLRLDDLARLDQLAFWARRHARSLTQQVGEHKLDQIELLANDLRSWGWRSGLLEKLAKLTPHEPRRWAFSRLNWPFFPDQRHRMRGWRSAGSNPPIADWCRRLSQSEPNSESRKTASDVLQWVIENIQLSKADRKTLADLLRQFPA